MGLLLVQQRLIARCPDMMTPKAASHQYVLHGEPTSRRRSGGRSLAGRDLASQATLRTSSGAFYRISAITLMDVSFDEPFTFESMQRTCIVFRRAQENQLCYKDRLVVVQFSQISLTSLLQPDLGLRNRAVCSYIIPWSTHPRWKKVTFHRLVSIGRSATSNDSVKRQKPALNFISLDNMRPTFDRGQKFFVIPPGRPCGAVECMAGEGRGSPTSIVLRKSGTQSQASVNVCHLPDHEI